MRFFGRIVHTNNNIHCIPYYWSVSVFVTYTRDVLDVLLCKCVFVCCCYYARTQYIESGLVGEMTAWQCHGATNATIFPCGQTTDFLSTRRCKYCEQVQFVWKHKHKLRDLKQSEWFEWMNQFLGECFEFGRFLMVSKGNFVEFLSRIATQIMNFSDFRIKKM